MDSRRIISQPKDSDRISNLPENIIESILGRLPIRAAVRTSILSKDWRYRWTTMPNLLFDSNQILYDDDSVDAEGEFKDETLAWIIYRILLRQHKGPIHKFSLSFQTSRFNPEIDEWIRYLSEKGTLREFNLDLNLGNVDYEIDSKLFSCAKLRELWLRGGIVIPKPPSTFNGFNDLTCLDFDHVVINNAAFESLIAMCPKLDSLSLYKVKDLDRLNIDHVPKLQSFYFIGGTVKYICLKNTPNLISATLGLDEIPEGSTSLDGLSNLTNLEAGYYFLKYMAQGSITLPSTFNNLNCITFWRLMFEDIDSLSSVLYMVTNSPNLRKLIVEAYTDSSKSLEREEAAEYLEDKSLALDDCCLKELEYVEMNHLLGLEPEIEFMKFILSKSPSLKQIKIKPHREIDIKDKADLLQKLLHYQALYRNAVFKYDDDQDD